MKNTGFYFLTSSLMMCAAFGIATDAYASNQVQLIMPPAEQQHYQMSATTNNSAQLNNKVAAIDYDTQAKIQAKKNSILQKIAQLRNSSDNTSSEYSVANGNTLLGNTPRALYSYTRLLDYSPHPRTESLLKDKPVLYKGKNYYFDVTYREEWKDVSADITTLTGLCFTVDVFENGKKVRNLTTPKITVSPKKIKKGQVIGIAEIAPFKLNIKVDDVVSNSKGVTELTFKLDLIG